MSASSGYGRIFPFNNAASHRQQLYQPLLDGQVANAYVVWNDWLFGSNTPPVTDSLPSVVQHFRLGRGF